MLSRLSLSLLIVPLVCYGCYGVWYGWQREALDWGLIGGMAAGGYLSSKAEPFFEKPLIQGPGDKEYRKERVPDSWVYASMFTTIGLASLLPNQEGWLNATSYSHLKGAAQAITAGYIIKELTKDIVGRPRPDYYDRLDQGIEITKARKSFPSGHATHFATGAAYLSLYVWDEWRSDEPLAVAAKSGITALLAAGAGWVCWTRVADNRHYPGDVAAGAVLGAGTALCFYSWQNWWGKPKEDENPSQSSIIQATPFSIGVRFSF
ncbi:MAG: phosphatase PAP2 family protein [candidate division WOR-3 bacterium]|nr:phosphatase PAP2 family protein [candidate division WOR-3 bacterium]